MEHLQRKRAKGECALRALILVPAFCFAASASAEIFKCVTKNGEPLYQNFPCQFDSIGSVSLGVQGPKMSSIPGAPIPAQPIEAIAPPDDPAEPRIGMTLHEIRNILGNPTEIVAEEGTDGIETWRYVDRNIQSDRTGRVVAVLMW